MKIPKFDIHTDFLVGNNITGPIIMLYSHYPVKLAAGVLVLCVRGSLTASFGISEQVVKPQDFLVLPPGIFFQVKKATDDLLLYFCAFSSKMLQTTFFSQFMVQLYSSFYFHPIIKLPEGHFQIYKEAFNLLVHAQELDKEGNKILTDSLVEGIIPIFMKGCTALLNQEETKETVQQEETNEYKISQMFIGLVMQQYRYEHRVSAYARQLNIPLNRLCIIVKKYLHMTALQFIDRMIILDAKFLLKSSREQIKQISIMLGFKNNSFFTKYFRKHTGVTPVEYRQS